MWLSWGLWYSSSHKHSNSSQSARVSQINQSHSKKKNSPRYQKSIKHQIELVSESKLKSSCLLCINNHKKSEFAYHHRQSLKIMKLSRLMAGKIPKFNYDSGSAPDEAIIESIHLNWNWYFAAFCLELKFHRANCTSNRNVFALNHYCNLIFHPHKTTMALRNSTLVRLDIRGLLCCKLNFIRGWLRIGFCYQFELVWLLGVWDFQEGLVNLIRLWEA